MLVFSARKRVPGRPHYSIIGFTRLRALEGGMAQTQPLKVQVPLRNVFDRLNRALAKEGKALHTRHKHPFGPYFITSTRDSAVVAHGIDEAGIEQLARDKGALKVWDEMQ